MVEGCAVVHWSAQQSMTESSIGQTALSSTISIHSIGWARSATTTSSTSATNGSEKCTFKSRRSLGAKNEACDNNYHSKNYHRTGGRDEDCEALNGSEATGDTTRGGGLRVIRLSR